MWTLMWSKIILNPKKDNLENGFLKPEYPLNFKMLPIHGQGSLLDAL